MSTNEYQSAIDGDYICRARRVDSGEFAPLSNLKQHPTLDVAEYYPRAKRLP